MLKNRLALKYKNWKKNFKKLEGIVKRYNWINLKNIYLVAKNEYPNQQKNIKRNSCKIHNI